MSPLSNFVAFVSPLCIYSVCIYVSITPCWFLFPMWFHLFIIPVNLRCTSASLVCLWMIIEVYSFLCVFAYHRRSRRFHSSIWRFIGMNITTYDFEWLLGWTVTWIKHGCFSMCHCPEAKPFTLSKTYWSHM